MFFVNQLHAWESGFEGFENICELKRLFLFLAHLLRFSRFPALARGLGRARGAAEPTPNRPRPQQSNAGKRDQKIEKAKTNKPRTHIFKTRHSKQRKKSNSNYYFTSNCNFLCVYTIFLSCKLPFTFFYTIMRFAKASVEMIYADIWGACMLYNSIIISLICSIAWSVCGLGKVRGFASSVTSYTSHGTHGLRQARSNTRELPVKPSRMSCVSVSLA